MSDIAASSFVRADLVPERPAPIKTTGFVGFLRTRLFNSPTNIMITIVSALLLWFTVIPAVRFLLIDAVWRGTDRNACLAENAGHVVGACWPYVQAKFSQFIYGFYPEQERWRVNVTFIVAAVLLLPLLAPNKADAVTAFGNTVSRPKKFGTPAVSALDRTADVTFFRLALSFIRTTTVMMSPTAAAR